MPDYSNDAADLIDKSLIKLSSTKRHYSKTNSDLPLHASLAGFFIHNIAGIEDKSHNIVFEYKRIPKRFRDKPNTQATLAAAKLENSFANLKNDSRAEELDMPSKASVGKCRGADPHYELAYDV